MKLNLKLLAASIVGVTLVACGRSESRTHLEVNDENCTIERIQKIDDQTDRENFAGLCSRRSIGPGSPTTDPKKW